MYKEIHARDHHQAVVKYPRLKVHKRVRLRGIGMSCCSALVEHFSVADIRGPSETLLLGRQAVCGRRSGYSRQKVTNYPRHRTLCMIGMFL